MCWKYITSYHIQKYSLKCVNTYKSILVPNSIVMYSVFNEKKQTKCFLFKKCYIIANPFFLVIIKNKIFFYIEMNINARRNVRHIGNFLFVDSFFLLSTYLWQKFVFVHRNHSLKLGIAASIKSNNMARNWKKWYLNCCPIFNRRLKLKRTLWKCWGADHQHSAANYNYHDSWLPHDKL